MPVERFAGQQRGGTGAERLVHLAHRHLIEIGVVGPELLAVGDEQHLVGLVVGPAQFAGPRQREAAAGVLLLAAAFGHHALGEHTLRGMGVGPESLELVDAASENAAGQQQPAKKNG